jgi:flavorubredoxin
MGFGITKNKNFFKNKNMEASDKTNILIVYHSTQGHSKRMAEAVADGVRSVDRTDVLLKSVDEAQPW